MRYCTRDNTLSGARAFSSSTHPPTHPSTSFKPPRISSTFLSPKEQLIQPPTHLLSFR